MDKILVSLLLLIGITPAPFSANDPFLQIKTQFHEELKKQHRKEQNQMVALNEHLVTKMKDLDRLMQNKIKLLQAQINLLKAEQASMQDKLSQLKSIVEAQRNSAPDSKE